MTELEARDHLATECGVTADIDDYVAGTTNEFGELLLFHQRPGTRTGTLYHSDMDWVPIPVDDDAISIQLLPIRTITVGEWILDREEAAWLAQRLLATSEMRSRQRRSPSP